MTYDPENGELLPDGSRIQTTTAGELADWLAENPPAPCGCEDPPAVRPVLCGEADLPRTHCAQKEDEEAIMSENYTEYTDRLEDESSAAIDSDEPWRMQRSTIGWDVVAVVGNEVVDIATCHTRTMAQFIASTRNAMCTPETRS